MPYLYAGLGIAMLSGITAMIQIGNNINNYSPLSSIKPDLYQSSGLSENDKEIMRILYNQSPPEKEICKHIKNQISSKSYEDGEVFISTGKQTPSTHPIFFQSCALVNKDTKHRVLITKSESGIYQYGLFSCRLDNEPYCNFEKNN
ncbi:MAG: hypothetical protein CL869_00795 [Cytophagia bacterium]|nr:hypothetical protein [Cytophagia bacterium]